MSVSINRQIGSIFVVIGTEVGAGILALPIFIAQMGFPLGVLTMFLVWALMTYTALLICEVNLAMADGCSFAGMAKNLLGVPGQAIVWISFLLLLYTIIIAYISAAGSTFSVNLHLNQHIISLCFVILFGGLVVIGITAVDWVTRLLLSIKLLSLLFVCIILIPHIHPAFLMPSFLNSTIFFTALPVFVTGFTSHLIIPPLRTYLRSDAKVISRVILIGSSIPLFLYIIWIIGVVGVIPHNGNNSFAIIFSKGSSANVGDILNLMKANLNNNLFYFPISLFSNISVTTSFLGVSLALYYFIIDGFKLNRLQPQNKNIIASITTFIIPLLIVWFYPNIFISALGYVGLCCTLLLIIMPYFMIRKLQRLNHQFKIRYINNNILLYITLFMGISIALMQILK